MISLCQAVTSIHSYALNPQPHLGNFYLPQVPGEQTFLLAGSSSSEPQAERKLRTSGCLNAILHRSARGPTESSHTEILV